MGQKKATLEDRLFVNGSFRYDLVAAAEKTSDGACLRVCINQDQRDNESINTQRFDHRQTNEHGNGNFTRSFGVPCNSFNRTFQTNTLSETATESGDGDSKTCSSYTRDEKL